MKIEHKQIKIRDLVEGYCNDDETGRVVAFGGKLDIRPAHQTCANGSRPYHSLVRRRPDNRHELSDAVQGLQSEKERQVEQKFRYRYT